jgi:hypothetical protein
VAHAARNGAPAAARGHELLAAADAAGRDVGDEPPRRIPQLGPPGLSPAGVCAADAAARTARPAAARHGRTGEAVAMGRIAACETCDTARLEVASMRNGTTRRAWTFGVVAALVAALHAAPNAQKVDVTGDWTFNVETGMGSGTPAITFKQDGEKLTGTYNGQLGNTTFTGTVKGTALEFSFTSEAQGQTIDVVYKGTVDSATTMKGSLAMAGGQVTGTFTGKKK